MSLSHTETSSPEPIGPFYVFEAEREAAIGDVLCGTRSDKAVAIEFASNRHFLTGHRTYVLSAAGSMIKDFSSDEQHVGGGK